VIAYKFLVTGAVGPISGVAWPQPAEGRAGAWLEADGPVAQCRRGIHACLVEHLAYWLHEELWRVELDGEAVPGLDCLIAPRGRLVEKVHAWSEQNGARRFAAAVRDHAAQAVSGLPAAQRTPLLGYIADSSWHVDHGVPASPALAALCASVGAARILPPEAQEDAYRRERAWQSAWIVKEMRLA
jgi:hypothetical protein